MPAGLGQRQAEVAALRRAGALLAEVLEIRAGRGGTVVVVAGTGIGATEQIGLPPGRRVVVAVLVEFAAIVGVVPEREDDRARVVLEMRRARVGGRLRAGILPRRTAHVPDGDDDLFATPTRVNLIEPTTRRNTLE